MRFACTAFSTASGVAFAIGFLPTTAFAMVAATGDIYYGLWYPIVVAAITLILGLLFLPETFKRPIDA